MKTRQTLLRFAPLPLFVAVAFACAEHHTTPAATTTTSGATASPSAAAVASAEPAWTPMKLEFTVDNLDRTADPCSDFYQFACGGWMKSHPIPPDQSRWGSFDALDQNNLAELKGLLEAAALSKSATGSNEQKIGDYYSSCMDQKAIDAAGLEPLQPELDRIAALKSKNDLPALIGHLHSIGINVLFGFGSGADFKNASMEIAQADQGGLSLPDRDYYLKDDPKSAEIRKGYVAHVAKMLTLAGDATDKAAAEADAIMKIETALAKGSMERVKRREPTNVYHKMSQKDWQLLTPEFDFAGYLHEYGAPKFDGINVAVPDFFKALDAELRDVSVDDLKTYLRWHLISSQTDELPTRFQDEHFAFYGKTLSGAKEIQPRWKRCTEAVDGDLGEALGQVYVAKYYPPEAVAKTNELVAGIESAMHQDLTSLDWMTKPTKEQAFGKLAAVQNKVGYPKKWRDYSTLTITPGDALGNSLRSNAFEEHRQLMKIGNPVDREEWGMTPPTVNAYYNPTENNINFPAGIFQPPFFDFKGDDAINYGGIGAVIGHELTHGFDDSGRQFDKDGNLKDWWQPADGKAFDERAKCLVDEYSSFHPLPDVSLNGKLTLGENTADNGGLRLAYMALMKKDGSGGAPIDGFTPQQRVFLGWASVWCQNVTDEASRMRATVDPHSPGRFRVNGVVRNMPEFQQAFSCKADAPMVGKPACRVW